MIKTVSENKTSAQKTTTRSRRVFYPACYALLIIQLSFINIAFAKGITLNMKGADINAVIATVAEATGKNFIIDPRVKGKVTIVSSKPLDIKQLYQVFLAILDVHGFTAVETGEVIKILPDSDAKHAGTPSEGVGEEVVTMVVEVKHIAAAQMIPILRPLVPPQGHLAAHAQTNTLIIADRVSNIERLMKIIKRIDEPSGSEIEIVQLEHASASEVVRVLTSLQQKKKKKGKGALTIVADERTNSILIGGEKTQRLGMKAIIAHLDTPSEVTGNTHVIYLNYAKAKDLVAVLTGVGQSKAKGAKKGAAKARARANTAFNIQADEATNALVITAAPDIYRSLDSVIRKLDIRRAQVMVEAIIAEVSVGHSSELGIQWFGDGTSSNLPVGITNLGTNSIAGVGAAIGTASDTGGSPLLAAIGQSSGMSLAVGRFNSDTVNFGMLISALAGMGEANLLSTPNIVTMDNEDAEIFVGREVSIPVGSFVQAGNASTNPFTTFKPKQVGIRLKVKPQINEGDAIKLEIDQTVDAITAGIAGTASLVTSQRTIKTSVMVEDGGIIVLGGLMTDDEKETVQKVPLLGDIPLLGYLFRYKRVEKEKSNLMVFLRPTILRDSAVTSAISGSKYHFMRNEQMRARGVEEETIMQMMPRIDEILPKSSLLKPTQAPDEPLSEAN